MNLLDLIIILAVVAYAIAGFRHGAVVGALSMIGFFGGAAVGAQLAEPLGSRVADGRAQVPVAIFCVLVLAMLGQVLGTLLAGRIRARVRSEAGRAIDSGVGLVLSALSVLLVAWMVAVPLASAPYPALASQASHSKIVRGVDDVMPNGVRNLYSSMRTFLDQSGFPPVLGDLPNGPNTPVPAPDSTLPPAVQARVDQAHRSTFKVYGQAPSCNRGIEGSGFVYAPHRILTNAHVVAGTREVYVQASENHNVPATVVLFDPKRDIAVLNVPDLDAAPLPLATATADKGDSAVVLGYPQDGPFNVQSARVRSRSTVSGNDIYGNSNVRREIYSLRAIVRSGNSGGPLLAEDGTVLGMVFATALDSSDTGYALTSGELASDAAAGRSATEPTGTSGCTPG